MEDIFCAGFVSELEKIADLIMGKKDAPVTHGGVFIGTSPNVDKQKQAAEEIIGLFKQHKSLQRAREEYQKKHPDDFVTLAFARGGGVRKDPNEGTKMFIRAGVAGSPDQHAFYNDVFGIPNEMDHSILLHQGPMPAKFVGLKRRK